MKLLILSVLCLLLLASGCIEEGTTPICSFKDEQGQGYAWGDACESKQQEPPQTQGFEYKSTILTCRTEFIDCSDEFGKPCVECPRQQEPSENIDATKHDSIHQEPPQTQGAEEEIIRVDAGKLLAVFDNGAHYSDDNGANWHNIFPEKPCTQHEDLNAFCRREGYVEYMELREVGSVCCKFITELDIKTCMDFDLLSEQPKRLRCETEGFE